MLSPGGEDFSAFAVPALYSARFAPPSEDAERCVIAVGRSSILVSDTDILLDSPHIGLND